MPKTVPTPVAVALGIVPAVVDSARRLPGKAAQIPVMAVSTALTALETARREYDELACRGERVVARLRGQSLDELEDWAESLVENTPLARPYDIVEDAVEDVVAKMSELLDRAGNGKGPAKAVQPVEIPKLVETAATPEVVEAVEAVSAAVDAPPITTHDELPLADYDHMTLGSLRGRLRSLSVEQLVQIRDYEKAHAHRLPVVTLLDNRIAKLAHDDTATPSPGGGEVILPAPDAVGKVTKEAAPKKSTPRTKVRKT